MRQPGALDVAGRDLYGMARGLKGMMNKGNCLSTMHDHADGTFDGDPWSVAVYLLDGCLQLRRRQGSERALLFVMFGISCSLVTALVFAKY